MSFSPKCVGRLVAGTAAASSQRRFGHRSATVRPRAFGRGHLGQWWLGPIRQEFVARSSKGRRGSAGRASGGRVMLLAMARWATFRCSRFGWTPPSAACCSKETLRLLRATGEHRPIPPREITPALSREGGRVRGHLPRAPRPLLGVARGKDRCASGLPSRSLFLEMARATSFHAARAV